MEGMLQKHYLHRVPKERVLSFLLPLSKTDWWFKTVSIFHPLTGKTSMFFKWFKTAIQTTNQKIMYFPPGKSPNVVWNHEEYSTSPRVNLTWRWVKCHERRCSISAVGRDSGPFESQELHESGGRTWKTVSLKKKNGASLGALGADVADHLRPGRHFFASRKRRVETSGQTLKKQKMLHCSDFCVILVLSFVRTASHIQSLKVGMSFGDTNIKKKKTYIGLEDQKGGRYQHLEHSDSWSRFFLIPSHKTVFFLRKGNMGNPVMWHFRAWNHVYIYITFFPLLIFLTSFRLLAFHRVGQSVLTISFSTNAQMHRKTAAMAASSSRSCWLDTKGFRRTLGHRLARFNGFLRTSGSTVSKEEVLRKDPEVLKLRNYFFGVVYGVNSDAKTFAHCMFQESSFFCATTRGVLPVSG